MIMEIGIGFAALFAALAVVFVAVRIAGTLRSMDRAVARTQQLLAKAETRLDEIGTETAVFMRRSNELAEGTLTKLRQLDSTFASIQDLGDAIREIASSVKQVSTAVSQTVLGTARHAALQQEKRFTEKADWTELALTLWNSVSARKKFTRGEDS